MEEIDKEKLREISTALMGLSMKFDYWISEIEKSRSCVSHLRTRLHNIVNKIKEEDLYD